MAAPETARTKQLRKLAEQLPGASERVTKGMKAARETQLQEQIAGAPKGAGTQAAQQLGAKQAAAAGQQALQAGAQQQQQLQQVGGLAAQERGLQAEQKVGEAQRGLSKQARRLADKLSEVSEDAKDELLDEQLSFKRDEANRALMNERQMADWAITKAKNREEYLDYAQSAMQMHERKVKMLKAAHDKIKQAIKQGYVIEGQRLDQDAKRKLIEQERAMKEKMIDEENKRRNKEAMWRAGGSLVGAGVGTYFGGAGGGKAGAETGGEAGGIGAAGFG